jgi:hypothetical protein
MPIQHLRAKWDPSYEEDEENCEDLPDPEYFDEPEDSVYEPEPLFRLCNADKALSIEPGGCIIICGMTKSGKTQLQQNMIVVNHHKFNRIIALCGTADLTRDYNYLPKRFVHGQFNEGTVKQILEDQERNPKRKTLLVIDDLIGKSGLKIKGETFDKIASSCRHYNLTVVFIVQNLLKLSTTIRDNACVLFITKIKGNSVKAANDMSSAFRTVGKCQEFLNQSSVDYQVTRMDLQPGYSNDIVQVFKKAPFSRPLQIYYN